MPNPFISKVTLPSGNTYDIKDGQVWGNNDPNTWPASMYPSSTYITDVIESLISSVAGLEGGDAVLFLGVSDTAITDSSTVSPIIIGSSTVEPKRGNLAFYGTHEFVYGTDNAWHELGSLDTLGSLAYKNSATAGYTPTGTVNGGSLSLDALSSTGTYTPSGTITTMASTGEWGDIVRVGAYAESASVDYYVPSGVSRPSFTGTAATLTAKGTPTGTIDAPTFTGEEVTINVPTITSVKYDKISGITKDTAGSTTNVKQVNGITQMISAVATVAPGGSAPSNPITYVSYDDTNETLKFNQLGQTKGNPVSTANVAVKNGDASYSYSTTQTTASINTGTSQKTFTPSGTISQPIFTGAELSSTVAYTPSGTVSKPNLETDNQRLWYYDTKVSSIASTFSGTPATITVSGTPSGSVSSLSFSGQASTITVS